MPVPWPSKYPHPLPPVLGVLWKTGYETDRRDGAGGQRLDDKDQETAQPGSGGAGEVLHVSAHDGSFVAPLLIVSGVSIGAGDSHDIGTADKDGESQIQILRGAGVAVGRITDYLSRTGETT